MRTWQNRVVAKTNDASSEARVKENAEASVRARRRQNAEATSAARAGWGEALKAEAGSGQPRLARGEATARDGGRVGGDGGKQASDRGRVRARAKGGAPLLPLPPAPPRTGAGSRATRPSRGRARGGKGGERRTGMGTRPTRAQPRVRRRCGARGTYREVDRARGARTMAVNLAGNLMVMPRRTSRWTLLGTLSTELVMYLLSRIHGWACRRTAGRAAPHPLAERNTAPGCSEARRGRTQ